MAFSHDQPLHILPVEQAHIKLSSFVSHLLGVSARRMLLALTEGETDPAALAALADYRLQATPKQLSDALGACAQLNGVYRRLLKMTHQDVVRRVAEVPGFGVDSSLQMADASPR